MNDIQRMLTGMDDKKKLFYLTNVEAEKICTWIVGNNYTLNSGYFELCFSFSTYGDYIEFTYSHDGNKDVLEVNNDSLADDPQRTVSHIVVDTQHVKLALSDEALDTYFQLCRKTTEAHVNADCEPPGSALIFEIHRDFCNVLSSRRELIEVLKKSFMQ